QAEDGIRDFHVTGVQTCALPIFPVMQRRPACALMWTTTSIVIVSSRLMTENSSPAPSADALTMSASWSQVCAVLPAWQLVIEPRSEERRVGEAQEVQVGQPQERR